jgi:hypothetical protein
MNHTFLEALKTRRSIYAIGAVPLVPEKDVENLIRTVVETTPSGFNSQSQRAVLLWGDESHRLWKIVLEALKKIVPEKSFPKTEAKIKGFDAGLGTVLFFDDSAITRGLMKDYPLYKDNFPVWAQQQAGMLQGNVWTGLSTLGYGASLQHYNELIETEVKAAFGIPESWTLLAQMPFGNVVKAAGPKESLPIEPRFLIKK